MNVFYNNTKNNIFFLPDSVLHLFTFLLFPNIYFAQILDFIKLSALVIFLE